MTTIETKIKGIKILLEDSTKEQSLTTDWDVPEEFGRYRCRATGTVKLDSRAINRILQYLGAKEFTISCHYETMYDFELVIMKPTD